MLTPSERADEYPAQGFLSRLVSAKSELGRQLTAVLGWPLRRYLRTLIPERPLAASGYLNYSARALAGYLTRRGYPDVDGACARLIECPVIQQADHSNLLLDSETFLNNFLFALACRERGVEQMITSQCSTVSCLSRREPVAGPVFLRTRGELYQVFGFSKRSLKDSTFCALPGPLTMSFKTLEGTGTPLQTDSFLRRFVGRVVDTAPDGYRICNDEIWDSLDREAMIPRVAVDEAMTSELVALHLEDSQGPVHTLVFEPSVRDRFLDVKRCLVKSAENLAVNRAEPDFFWYRKGTRLIPLILVKRNGETAFVLETDGTVLPIPYTSAAIAQALREGLLYADRILSYTVRCLLPEIVAVGGTSQQDYVKLYQQMLLQCHEAESFLDQEDVRRIGREGASRLGGAPLVELSSAQQQVLAGLNEKTDLRGFAESFLDQPVGITIGMLNCAKYFEPAIAKRES